MHINIKVHMTVCELGRTSLLCLCKDGACRKKFIGFLFLYIRRFPINSEYFKSLPDHPVNVFLVF